VTAPPDPGALVGTSPTRVPGVPEITLALASEPFALWQDAADPFPYWAFAWPGGQLLARWWLDEPALVRGRSVIDLGCGSGLVGIAAMRAGAARVTCVDIDPQAIAATRHNAALNLVCVQTWLGDLLAGAQPAFVATADVVVAGDLLYERDLAHAVLAWLAERAHAGAWALAGDAYRNYAPGEGVRVVHAQPVAVQPAVETGPVRAARVLEIGTR